MQWLWTAGWWANLYIDLSWFGYPRLFIELGIKRFSLRVQMPYLRDGERRRCGWARWGGLFRTFEIQLGTILWVWWKLKYPGFTKEELEVARQVGEKRGRPMMAWEIMKMRRDKR